jgi:hypothetical protein
MFLLFCGLWEIFSGDITKNSGFNLDGHFSSFCTWIFLPAENAGVFLAWYQCFSTGLFIRSFCTTDLSRGNWRKLLKQSCRTVVGWNLLAAVQAAPISIWTQWHLFFSRCCWPSLTYFWIWRWKSNPRVTPRPSENSMAASPPEHHIVGWLKNAHTMLFVTQMHKTLTHICSVYIHTIHTYVCYRCL